MPTNTQMQTKTDQEFAKLTDDELAKEIGFDIYTDEFWQKGMEQAREFIDQLEKTIQ